MSVDNTLNEIKRGERAEELLNNEVYKEAISKVRDGIIKALETSPFGDMETHNRLAIALQLLNQIEKSIKTVADTGKMAQLQVKQGLKQQFSSVFRR